MATLGDRLNLAAKRFGFKTLASLERSMGLTKNSLTKIGDGANTRTILKVVEKIPQLNIEWLLTGEGGMVKAEAQGVLPLLPFSAVAGFLSDNNNDESVFEDAFVVPDFTKRGAEFAIRVDGDSMSPRFQSGEILAVKIVRDPSFFQWGRVYVLSTTQGCVIKKLYPDPDDDNSVICRSEDTAGYPDYSLPKSDILHVAIVIGHIGLD